MFRYLHLDVFTDRRFEGNQLAVFPEPQGLTTEEMQRIAKEMNFSESTFIFPPEGGGDVRMRIFTPGEELPMAGHPTIGSTFALAIEGTIPRGRHEFIFELGVGPTPVALEWEKSGLSFAWMTQPLPVFGTVLGDRIAMELHMHGHRPAFPFGDGHQAVDADFHRELEAVATFHGFEHLLFAIARCE